MTTTTEGWVYLLSNPAWPGWLKTGKTVDTADRVSNYQTGDPFRSYRLEHAEPTTDHHASEYLFRFALERQGYERRREWFRVDLDTAKAILAETIRHVEEDPEF